MSFIYSQALVEEFSLANHSDTVAFAPLSSTPMPNLCLWHDKTMEPSTHSQFGMTCELLTEGHGEALLMWWLEASHAKTLVRKAEGTDSMEKEADSGAKWHGSLAKFDPDSSTLKTVQDSFFGDLIESSLTLPAWGLMLNGDVFQHPLSALLIGGSESGLLPTPMASDWKGGTSSIRKDTGKQRLDQFRDWCKSIHGLTYPIPEHSEAVMGWPIGHTDLRPLGTGKCRSAPLSPTDCLEGSK